MTMKIRTWLCKCGSPVSLLCGFASALMVDEIYEQGGYALCTSCTMAHEKANKFVPRSETGPSADLIIIDEAVCPRCSTPLGDPHDDDEYDAVCEDCCAVCCDG